MKRYVGTFKTIKGNEVKLETKINYKSIKRYVMLFNLVGTAKGTMASNWRLFSLFFIVLE